MPSFEQQDLDNEEPEELIEGLPAYPLDHFGSSRFTPSDASRDQIENYAVFQRRRTHAAVQLAHQGKNSKEIYIDSGLFGSRSEFRHPDVSQGRSGTPMTLPEGPNSRALNQEFIGAATTGITQTDPIDVSIIIQPGSNPRAMNINEDALRKEMKTRSIPEKYLQDLKGQIFVATRRMTVFDEQGVPSTFRIITAQTLSGEHIPSSIIVETDTHQFAWGHPTAGKWNTLSSNHLGESAMHTLLEDGFARLDALRAQAPFGKTPATPDTQNEFLRAIYRIATAMPSPRGSAGAGDAYFSAMYLSIFGKLMPRMDGIDRFAMSMRDSDFVAKFHSKL